MDKSRTITQITKLLGISTRMLRYYEQIGLLQSRNNPDEPNRGKGHGYERWVTIPDEWELTAPFVKKAFPGGLYAAHMIPLGAFEEWSWLYDWVATAGSMISVGEQSATIFAAG